MLPLRPTSTPIPESGFTTSTTLQGRICAVSVSSYCFGYTGKVPRKKQVISHQAFLSCSPSCRASRVCPVPLLPERPPAGRRLCGSHRERAVRLRRVQPQGRVQLPERIPLPVLGAVHRPQTLVPAGDQRGAGLHLPGLRDPAAQPLDRRHHCKPPDSPSHPPLLPTCVCTSRYLNNIISAFLPLLFLSLSSHPSQHSSITLSRGPLSLC